MISCPRCNLAVTELHSPDADLRTRVEAVGEQVPPQICAGCISDLKKFVATSSGGVLMAQERAKENQRITMWKSRVGLVKQARNFMSQRKFSEAAVSYEKYLRIIEIVFEVKKGESLTPELFKESQRTSELTVVASTYWDLLRIYDTHDKYHDRMVKSAKQLSVFIRFTPIYPDIMKKAESFSRSAKNPQIIRNFLKLSGDQRPRCFIATSAFESPLALEVQLLRFYRDEKLSKTELGRTFIKSYYRFSPIIAAKLDAHPWFKKPVRSVLRLMIKCVS